MLSQSKETVMSVANAVALVTAVVHQVAGNEVANTIAGTPVKLSGLNDLAGSRLHANFSNFTSKGTQS